MSKYDEYINRLCYNRNCTIEYAEELELSREVKKYYDQEVDQDDISRSTFTPAGECR